MSYASKASLNALPQSQQPHADPALLNTGTAPTLPPVDAHNHKINIAAPGFKENPSTVTSEHPIPSDAELEARWDSRDSGRGPGIPSSGRSRKEKAKEELHKAEEESAHLWEIAKTQLLRPGVAGGLVGLVNVGLLATATYQFYTYPHLRTDRTALGGTIGGALVLLAAEGALGEAYAQTEAGREEAERAKREGAYVWRRSKEVILRPAALGGLVGLVNVGLLGGAAYTFYSRPELQSDRRLISVVTLGLLGLFTAEGFFIDQYAK